MQITELVDDDGIIWRWHRDNNTYQPGDSVPMDAQLFRARLP